jgi:hypothetical protein
VLFAVARVASSRPTSARSGDPRVFTYHEPALLGAVRVGDETLQRPTYFLILP